MATRTDLIRDDDKPGHVFVMLESLALLSRMESSFQADEPSGPA